MGKKSSVAPLQARAAQYERKESDSARSEGDSKTLSDEPTSLSRIASASGVPTLPDGTVTSGANTGKVGMDDERMMSHVERMAAEVSNPDAAGDKTESEAGSRLRATRKHSWRGLRSLARTMGKMRVAQNARDPLTEWKHFQEEATDYKGKKWCVRASAARAPPLLTPAPPQVRHEARQPVPQGVGPNECVARRRARAARVGLLTRARGYAAQSPSWSCTSPC